MTLEKEGYRDDKVTFTLRLPEEKNKSIKELADSIGMSQNSLILLFVELGTRSYKNAILQNQEEFHRFLSQTQQ